MKKRNKKFKTEKIPREKSLNLGPKPSLKGDFRFWKASRPRGRRQTARIKILFFSCDLPFIDL